MNAIIELTLDPATPRFDRARWLTMFGVFVAFAMMLLGSIALFAARNDAWTQARLSANNLLLALDRDITRNILMLDLSIQGVMEALDEPGIDQATPGVRFHALFDRSATAEDLGSVLVLNQDGDVVEDSTSVDPHRLNLGDREYFQVHKNNPDAGLYISRVFKSRIGNGDLRFAISRRISGPDGSFRGVVSATLRLSYFLRLFEKLDVGSKGSITLLRTDGRILVRYPFRPEDVDADISARPNYLLLTEADAGQYVTNSALDSVERLTTYRRGRNLPLISAVNLSVDEILAPWKRKAAVIGPVLITLCASAVASSMLFRREMIRRTASELALAQAVQQLAVLAATDGLTGLLNRRSFDVEYERAFNRAVRHGTSLAILMIDADFFKGYNDAYGHLAGDAALRTIADCLQTHLRRPDDQGARYGGEEFVALLPETNLTAAYLLAERIRFAVEERSVPHNQSPLGHLTISIGIGVTTPLVGQTPSELLHIADQALYAAKRQGRNQVQSIPEGQRATPPNFEHLVAATRPNPSRAVS